MCKFGLESSSGKDSEDENEDNLPYPEALQRSDFLTEGFDALTYLSSLSNRHQSLEDLRSDLRERSQFLSKELLDLVNANYQQFLNLDSDLSGGEEGLEDVRVGLLGFKSGVLDILEKVKTKKDKIDSLIRQKRSICRQITFGRKLLELDARLENLEDSLKSSSSVQVITKSKESDSLAEIREKNKENEMSTEAEFSEISVENLQRLTTEFCYIKDLMARMGTNHPYIMAQQARITMCRTEILINLRKVLNTTEMEGEYENTRIIELLGIYRELGAADEAIKALRESKLRKK